MNIVDPAAIAGKFNFAGSVTDVAPLGSGHIHKTWLIKTSFQKHPGYILQQINHKVFPHVEEMMSNIVRVIRYLREKSPKGSINSVLEIIPTANGGSFLKDEKGFYWRMYDKIDPGISYDIVPDAKIAYEAGLAFGYFIARLVDFPANSLFPVIPRFHSLQWRHEQLTQAVNENFAKRVSRVENQLEMADEFYQKLAGISEIGINAILPYRVTHNDTKLNNVLFDHEGNAVCVIDLDTVMPGLVLYDFGDTIRTAANTAPEDEPNHDKIRFNLSVFEAFSRGFIKKTLQFLTPLEKETLVYGGQYMTLIMAIRFLTDHLNGDVYYPIRFPEHNLVRCKAHLRLLRLMEAQHQRCREIHETIFDELKG